MKTQLWLCLLVLTALVSSVGAQQRIKVDATTPPGQIIMMDPKLVDASALPLTSVESLHSTGTPQLVVIQRWRLTVSGKQAKTQLSLTYDDLLKLPTVKKRVLLICPGFFYDYLEWEGISLQTFLEKAGVENFSRVIFTSVDGYREEFKKQEVEAGLVMVAIKGNGVALPQTQGFPARVVAEGIYGGRWVKYLTSITLE